MTRDEPPTPDDAPDNRQLRLMDLAPHESILVRCRCGRTTEYLYGVLQRHHGVQSDTLIFDLQFRLRCSVCSTREGFRISIRDGRRSRMTWDECAERVVVA